MYIQITTRCNMHCKHCCYSCTAKGEDMSLETFRNALKWDDVISIGGGEPTIHPLFWQFLGEALGTDTDFVWLATNGKETRTALALAKMARKGIIGCALSQDEYHEPIDPLVVQAFTRERKGMNVGYQDREVKDGREIRNVTGKEIKAGRCKHGDTDKCVCEEMVVKPNGDVKACGCKDAPCFGNVNTEVKIPENWEPGTCCHHQPE